MSRYPHSLDEDGVREVWVKENSGADLLQTFNAYALERDIRLPKGTFTLADLLATPNDSVEKRIKLIGQGMDKTTIVGGGGAPFTDDSIIKSLSTSWTGAPRFVLEDLSLKGSGVEQYLAYFNYALGYLNRVTFCGTMRGAGNTYMLYQVGSGPPSVPNGMDNVFFAPDGGTITEAAHIHGENYRIGNMNPCASGGSITTGLWIDLMPAEIGTIGAFIGTGKSMSRVVDAACALHIGSIFVAPAASPANVPYPIRSNGMPVKIDAIHTGLLPTGGNMVGEDAITLQSIMVDLWRHSYAYASSLVTKTDPNTTYVLWDAAYDLTVDLTHWTRAKILLDNASGNEAGSGKGVAIYNSTNSAVLCDVTWNGTGNIARAGNWVDISALTGAKALRLYVKGSSATEDVSFIYGISLILGGWRF
jgi:hypothetical protein